MLSLEAPHLSFSLSRTRCSTLPPQRGSSIDTPCSLAAAKKCHQASAPGKRERFHALPLR